MKKYLTKGSSLQIEEIEIAKESNSFVWVANKRGMGSREAKISSWKRFHDSKEDAIAFLMFSIQAKIEEAKQRLMYEEEQLQKIKKRFGL